MSERSDLLSLTADERGLVLAGEIDALTAPLLGEMLSPLPGDDGDVRLDLRDVEFIDSSGLRVIIEAHQRATDAGRRLVLAAPSRSVRRLLEISGLNDHLHLADD